MKTNLIYIALLIAMPSICIAESEDQNQNANAIRPFIGIKGGVQAAHDNNSDQKNLNSGVVGIFGGLQLTPRWRWDVGYQDHGELKAKTTGIKIKTSLIESAIRYDWYVQDSLSLYGRLGAAYWNIKKNSLNQDQSVSGFSPLSEIGISYTLSTNWKLSAGYQYIDALGNNHKTGQYDGNSLLISAAYSFGSSHTLPTNDAPVIGDAVIYKTPPKAPQIEKAHNMEVIEAITFKFGSASLHKVPSFKLLLAELKKYPAESVYVIGHTDSTGPAAYNQTLSKNRARVVASALLNKGVDASRIIIIGKGESEPIATNKTKQGRARNRHVEIVVY